MSEHLHTLQQEVEKWLKKAENMRPYQTSGMLILLLSLSFYLLFDSFFFKTMSFLSLILIGGIIVYFSVYVDPNWKRAIRKYQEVFQHETMQDIMNQANNNVIVKAKKDIKQGDIITNDDIVSEIKNEVPKI